MLENPDSFENVFDAKSSNLNEDKLKWSALLLSLKLKNQYLKNPSFRLGKPKFVDDSIFAKHEL